MTTWDLFDVTLVFTDRAEICRCWIINRDLLKKNDLWLGEIIQYDVLARRYFDNHLKTDRLLEPIIYALQVMQRDQTYYGSNEDSRNRFVSSNLAAQLKGTGYTCADQQTGGASPTGKAPGERDFVVKDKDGQEVLIYEGLNLKSFDRAYIDKHIDKVLANYNPQGLRDCVLVTYLECDRERFNIN